MGHGEYGVLISNNRQDPLLRSAFYSLQNPDRLIEIGKVLDGQHTGLRCKVNKVRSQSQS